MATNVATGTKIFEKKANEGNIRRVRKIFSNEALDLMIFIAMDNPNKKVYVGWIVIST